MGALYIKDEKTAFLAERVAGRLGTTKTEAVRQALEKLEAAMEPVGPKGKLSTVEWIREFRKKHPLPEKLGPVPGKAFYDELSGDL
jgi:antitoxin VapB